jgi:hypothetical protein
LSWKYQICSLLIMLIHWVKKVDIIKTELLLDASKEVGAEGNAEETKCVFLSRHHTTG